MSLKLFRERLIFGTGRLVSGGYAPQSRHMIAACRKAGITRFDTAPLYGMGGAEELLGEAAGQDATLHTKIGSPRPTFPSLRGWAKRLRNLGPNPAAAKRIELAPEPFSGPSAQMDFSAASVARSLARSRQLLRRHRLDLVLLHEAEPWQIPAETLRLLEQEVRLGGIAQLGYAHSGPPLRTLTGWVAQCAPWPEDLESLTTGKSRIFHSILRGLAAAAKVNSACSTGLASAAAELGLAGEGLAGDYLAALVWLHRQLPDAGLIFATSDPGRLDQFIALLDRIAPRR